MDKVDLNIIAGVEYCGSLYVSTREINGLFCLDLSTMKMTYLRNFSTEDEIRALYRNAFLYKNKAWFIPGRGQFITIVDLDTLNIRYREFPFKKKKQEIILQKRGLYSSVYSSMGLIADKFLYLIPLNVDALLIVDMEREEFYPYYDIAKLDGRLLNGTYANGKIYLLPERGNDLIVLDLNTKEKKNYNIEALHTFDTYIGVVYYKNKIWIAPQNGEYILSLDLNIQNAEMIRFGGCHEKQGRYHGIFIDGNELFFLPHWSDEILKFNMEDRQLVRIRLDDCLIGKGESSLWKLSVSEKNIIFYFARKRMLLLYDKFKEKFKKVKVSIEKEFLSKILHEQIDSKLIKYQCNGCYEEDVLGIGEFVETIVNNEYKRRNRNRDTGTAIWNAID